MQIQTVGLLFLGSILVMALLYLTSATFFTVKRQTIAIVERFGRFVRTVPSGAHLKFPFIEQIAGVVNLRVQQSEVEVETQTEDNILVRIIISVQYRALPERAYDAFFCLKDADLKINSCVSDTVDAMISKMELKEVLKRTGDISSVLQNKLGQMMEGFGYDVLMPSVTGIKPGAIKAMSPDDMAVSPRLETATASQNTT